MDDAPIDNYTVEPRGMNETRGFTHTAQVHSTQNACVFRIP